MKNLIVRVHDDFGGDEFHTVKLGEPIDLGTEPPARSIEIRCGFMKDGKPILIETYEDDEERVTRSPEIVRSIHDEPNCPSGWLDSTQWHAVYALVDAIDRLETEDREGRDYLVHAIRCVMTDLSVSSKGLGGDR